MILPVAFLLAGCLAVNSASDQVTTADLAPGFPGMDKLDAGIALALAPAPGVTRIFRLAELKRWAERFHLTPPAAEICVQRPMAPLDPEKAMAAMHASLPEAQISVLEWSRARVPLGEIAFPTSQLRTDPAGQWWTGYVRYGGVHQFAIWARVSVRMTAERVVALRDLPPGQPIPADAIETQTRETISGTADFALSMDQVADKLPRALIRAGTPVQIHQLAPPVDIVRGDTVQVDAESGAAHLEFEARAEGSGATGEMIPLRNPVSHRRFMARVTGKGRALVGGSAAQGKS
jgi:flagella basal body P-ring formation protein FlgA